MDCLKKLKMTNSFTLDFWTFFGLIAQGMLFLRFLIQWWATEKSKKIIIPLSFWYISIIGYVMVGIYAIVRNDIVFLSAAIVQTVLFTRNLFIAKYKNE